MIVATMSEQELFTSLMSDAKAIVQKSNYLDKKYRRNVLKRTVFPYMEIHEWKSPSKNDWLIYIISKNRKEVGDYCRVHYVAIANFQIGIHAFLLTFIGGKPMLLVFPPHFFSRYAKRTGKTINGIKLIKEYFKHNCDYGFTQRKTDKHHEIYGSTEEGIAMGVMTKYNNVLFKTFITYDMSKGDQIEKFLESNELRKEIHDL